jgi:hypothetical protein
LDCFTIFAFTFRIKNVLVCSRTPRSKSGKTQKADPAATGQAVKDTINNNTKLRVAALNFGISKTKLSCYLWQFQEQEPPTDFECSVRNSAKNF